LDRARGPEKGPQISQTIIVENLELAPIQTQSALFDVMRTQRLVLHGYRYTTSELFSVIAIIGHNEDNERVNELTEQMVCTLFV
jgi:hypothetical protein